MNYGCFINLLNQLEIEEIDSFEIIFVDKYGVEKIIKLYDLI